MDQLSRLKQTLAGLGPTRLMALAAVGAAVLAVVALVALRSGEPMGLLYSGMDLSEAGRVAAKLDEMKIPMEARDGGSTLLVPQSEVARARMALAMAGLPHEGGPGYELLDTQSPMSMTSFMQRVQRLRALEGELARTILTLDGVRSARVHIVMPEQESFARSEVTPTASVAVTMNGVLRLTASQAAAIRLLVAGAVPQLRASAVSIVDPSGVVVAADGGDTLAAGRIGEIKAAREQALRRAVLDLLEPIVGRGRVRVVASVEVDATRETSRAEKFDPLSQVERSRQTRLDQDTSQDKRPEQPVTVGQNLPDQHATSVDQGTTTTSTHRSETINYELSSTVSEQTREPGAVKRLGIAVVVDGLPSADGKFHPRSQEELAKLTDLVRSAVGFDDKRGDRITVESLPFVAESFAGAPEQTGEPATAPSLVPMAAAGLLVLLLAAGGGWFALRRRTALPRPLQLQQPALAGAGVEEEMVTITTVSGPVRASAIADLNELLDTRMDEAVAVLKDWLAEGAAA